MNPNLLIAIQITVVGMALVFAAIILLWGLMALLVRVTAEKPETVEVASATTDTLSAKRQAAIAAVAVVLALEKESKPAMQMVLPPTATVSAWQAAMRANRLKLRGPVR